MKQSARRPQPASRLDGARNAIVRPGLLQRLQNHAETSARTEQLRNTQRHADLSAPVQLLKRNTIAGPVVQREFTNADSRTRHYNKHGAEFGAADEGSYEASSETFYANRGNHQSKVSDGKTYVYDSGTDTLGVYTSGGKTITFFKPGRGNATKGQKYYDKQ